MAENGKADKSCRIVFLTMFCWIGTSLCWPKIGCFFFTNSSWVDCISSSVLSSIGALLHSFPNPDFRQLLPIFMPNSRRLHEVFFIFHQDFKLIQRVWQLRRDKIFSSPISRSGWNTVFYARFNHAYVLSWFFEERVESRCKTSKCWNGVRRVISIWVLTARNQPSVDQRAAAVLNRHTRVEIKTESGFKTSDHVDDQSLKELAKF